MARRVTRNAPVKLVEAASLFDESIAIYCSTAADHATEVAAIIADLERAETQAKEMLRLLPAKARENTLRHNAAALAARDRVRFLTGARACFKCRALFIDADPTHRGCWACYREYAASLPPRPGFGGDDDEHPNDCGCDECRDKYYFADEADDPREIVPGVNGACEADGAGMESMNPAVAETPHDPVSGDELPF